MLMKIGDVTNQFGISHRSLHYWESAGILQSIRKDNDYRYYDEENLLKIKQIVLLRKLRLSIPSIQEIFTSDDLSKIITVFVSHLEESKQETTQLNALGIVLQQLIHMLKDRQSIETVYDYLDANHACETEELKDALRTVLTEPIQEIAAQKAESPVIDMTGVDLSLEPMEEKDIEEVTTVIKRCYENTKEIDKLLDYFNIRQQLSMPGCTCYYKIMSNNTCIGAVDLAYVGMEAMLIRCFACLDPGLNVYLFELMKNQYPQVLCWMIRNAPEGEPFHGMENFNYDWEGKKQQFWEDNGFTFYTDARYNQFIKMLKPHDVVYNSSRYRFALLDGSMNNVSFRFFGMTGLDFYDGAMPQARFTDVYFADACIYDTGMERSKFYSTFMEDCDFRYSTLERSRFNHTNLKNCRLTQCDIEGMTIDGINVEEALNAYKSETK